MNLRSIREKESVDRSDIYQKSEAWHQSYAHVFQCPNSMRHEATLQKIIGDRISGKRVLDIGCGYGGSSIELLEQQASYVMGVDISERFIATARNYAQKDRLDFILHDISQPISGQYDLIFGRAILHHLDYQEVLQRLYRDNLNPGGSMIFMEPLGSNPLLKLYWWIAKDAHTPDERPFMRSDLRWLQSQFEQFTLIPINCFSLPLGILSSKLLSRPDNLLMQLADWLDTKLANIKYLQAEYRQAIFVIGK